MSPDDRYLEIFTLGRVGIGKFKVSKGDFMFAATTRVPVLMAEFERDVLMRCTPCNFTVRTLVEAQAGLPLLDFSPVTGEKKQGYFAAVRAGLDRNHRPMEKIFSDVIDLSVAES